MESTAPHNLESSATKRKAELYLLQNAPDEAIAFLSVGVMAARPRAGCSTDSLLPDPRLTVTPLQALLGMGFLGLFQQQLSPWAWGRRASSCFHQSLPSSPPLEVQQADSSVTLLLTRGVQLKPSLARHSSIQRPSRATKRRRS